MKKIVEFEVEGAPPVYVEVEAGREGEGGRHGRYGVGEDDEPLERRRSIEPERDDDLAGPWGDRVEERGTVISESGPYGSRYSAVSWGGGRWRGALEQVRPAVEDMIDVFRAVATPEEVAVEFSLKFNGRVNAFVFSSDSEATFKVSLKWTNQKAASGGGVEAGSQAGTRSGA